MITYAVTVKRKQSDYYYCTAMYVYCSNGNQTTILRHAQYNYYYYYYSSNSLQLRNNFLSWGNPTKGNQILIEESVSLGLCIMVSIGSAPLGQAVIQRWPYYTASFICNRNLFGTCTSGCYRVADHLNQVTNNTGSTFKPILSAIQTLLGK